jgi:hypothetical protein
MAHFNHERQPLKDELAASPAPTTPDSFGRPAVADKALAALRVLTQVFDYGIRGDVYAFLALDHDESASAIVPTVGRVLID